MSGYKLLALTEQVLAVDVRTNVLLVHGTTAAACMVVSGSVRAHSDDHDKR